MYAPAHIIKFSPTAKVLPAAKVFVHIWGKVHENFDMTDKELYYVRKKESARIPFCIISHFANEGTIT